MNQEVLFYGLGGAIGLFTIILTVLCGCLCYLRWCRPRSPPKPRPASKGRGVNVSFTGNFENTDNISDDGHQTLPGTQHIYEDLETIRAQKKQLEEKEKAKESEKTTADPESGETEHSKTNGHATIVTVNENAIISNGQVQISKGVTNESIPNGGVPNGGVPNGGVPNGGVPNGVVLNGGVPNGGVPKGGVPSGGVPNGGVPNGEVPIGGVKNIGVPNGKVPNGGVPSERRSSHGILTNQNVSAAVFTAQVPGSYHTLPNGVGSGKKKTDKEPIYAKPGQYSKTNKKKKEPKVKFNVPKGLAPGDTLPKTPTTPTTPKTPEVPPKADVMY